MFKLLGIGESASALLGVGTGALVTHAIHKVTTGRKVKKLEKVENSLEKRLGGSSPKHIERAIRKTAILKILAYKDGVFSIEEKVFINDYILQHPHLPADIKVELLLEMNEPPPTYIGEILKKVTSSLKFNDIFESKEEATGFVRIMYDLSGIDGSIDKFEIEYVKKICDCCKITNDLMPLSIEKKI
ncbi:MAG: TerB family tellurite resistance protein [Candidatus Marithrix sp.]|nr:TerB family tellurite resistance protein [Candidatus Marithrix sp.]